MKLVFLSIFLFVSYSLTLTLSFQRNKYILIARKFDSGNMATFDRIPVERFVNDLKYFWDCCLAKKKRKERFEQIGHCNYWFTDEAMINEYDRLKEQCTDILKAKLKFADYIYPQFEREFGFREHEEWCIYDTHRTKLRVGIKKLGETLHALCHAPLDLIRFRATGLHLLNKKFDLDKINPAFCKGKLDEVRECLKNEDADAKECRFIFRKEQFIAHYFEITSLRDIISEEIKLYEKQTSTLLAWMGVFGSVLISLQISLVSSIILPIIGLLLLASIIWYIWASIKLNEAKDVMYICLGVDIDNLEACIVCE